MEDVPGRYPFHDSLFGRSLHDHRDFSRRVDVRTISYCQDRRHPDELADWACLRHLQGLVVQIYKPQGGVMGTGRDRRYDRLPQLPGSALRHRPLDRRSFTEANARICNKHDAHLRTGRPALRDFPPSLQKMDSFTFLAKNRKKAVPGQVTGNGLFNLVEARSIELRSDSGQPDRLYERSHRFRVGFELPVTGSLLPSSLVLAGVRVQFLRSGPPFWRL